MKVNALVPWMGAKRSLATEIVAESRSWGRRCTGACAAPCRAKICTAWPWSAWTAGRQPLDARIWSGPTIIFW